ncbi:MAG: hypothetical protein JKY09_02270, partial [Crocinitomicaceae bacterium]|nr:hypothetical protein [Crocinitomicaceae bacterium]
MVNRILLSIIVIVSLTWIGYMAFDTVSDRNNYTPETLFNAADDELLVVIRPTEVQFTQLTGFSSSPSFELYSLLNDSIYKQGYLSLNRPHFLLVKNDHWNPSNITSAFQNENIEFSSSNRFTMGAYQGRYHKTKLYVWKGDISPIKNPKKIAFSYDKKASAAILTFSTSFGITKHSDIYFKGDGQIIYVTKDQSIEQGNQVKDEVLFAGLVSRNFNSYHFYERDYYATLDDTFEKGPMSKWMLNGFVELDYKGKTVLITDYIEGQDPILIMNDLNQTQDSTRFSQPLAKNFPSKNGSYSIKYLEDLVVIGEDSEICDRIIADYKLGHTIALSEKARARVYGRLPKAVSERFISDSQSISRAVYQGKLLETHTGIEPKEITTIQKEPITISCGYDISDFAVLPGDGNVITLGKNGELNRFENQTSTWSTKVDGKPIGKIQLIDLHGSGESFVLLNTKNEIHLWNMTGHYETGFPIKLESDASNEVKFYRWKGKSYFIIANTDNKVVHFDAKGRELNIINPGISVDRKIDVWASQRNLFAGFTNSSNFIM